MRVVIISGLSGAGKSVALGMLEDLGYTCIDNLPIGLLRDVTADTLKNQEPHCERLAVGVDARARADAIQGFPARVAEIKAAGVDISVIYFEADSDVILRRYSETRRKHPLTDANTPLVEAVAAERRVLAPIAEQADLLIDTSHTTVHQLRELVRSRVDAAGDGGMSILLQSFGFKYGVPEAVDFVFDVRCLPNPYWDAKLKDATGLDPEVAAYLEDSPDTVKMLADIGDFLERWLPAFARDNRAYITIAVGCTGGHHRSVYLVEQLAKRVRKTWPGALVQHSELA